MNVHLNVRLIRLYELNLRLFFTPNDARGLERESLLAA